MGHQQTGYLQVRLTFMIQANMYLSLISPQKFLSLGNGKNNNLLKQITSINELKY